MKQLKLKSESFQYVEISFGRWLDVLGYAEATIYQLPNYIRELFHWLENEKHINQINQITTPLIREYYQDLKHRTNNRKGGALSNNYLNKHLQGLYKLMDYLRQTGRLTLPSLEIQREEDNPKPIEVLTVSQIKSLYAATNINEAPKKRNAMQHHLEYLTARDRAILCIYYGCGLRRNEGYHLNITDINWERSTLHVRKGKNYKERFVPIAKTNLKTLQTYIYDYRSHFIKPNNPSDALFISYRGTRLQPQSLILRLKELQKKTDDIELQQKDISLHTLRHSIATHFLQSGMELKKIQQFLGHSSLESTQIYTHLAIPSDNK